MLVVYAHDRGPAEIISHALRSDDFTVELADACAVGVPRPEGFDAVVLVVHRGWFHHAHALETYVREHETALRARPTGTFMVPHAPHHTIESEARAFVRSFADEIPAAESEPSV